MSELLADFPHAEVVYRSLRLSELRQQSADAGLVDSVRNYGLKRADRLACAQGRTNGMTMPRLVSDERSCRVLSDEARGPRHSKWLSSDTEQRDMLEEREGQTPGCYILRDLANVKANTTLSVPGSGLVTV